MEVMILLRIINHFQSNYQITHLGIDVIRCWCYANRSDIEIYSGDYVLEYNRVLLLELQKLCISIVAAGRVVCELMLVHFTIIYFMKKSITDRLYICSFYLLPLSGRSCLCVFRMARIHVQGLLDRYE